MKKIFDQNSKMDPEEIQEWIESLDGVVQRNGKMEPKKY